MNAIVYLDLWILDKCQRFSDWLTKSFGIPRANLKVAYVLLTFIVANLAGISFILVPENGALNILPAVVGLSLGLFYFILFYQPEANRKDDGETRKNPGEYFAFRIIMWILVIYRYLGVYLPKYAWGEGLGGEDYFQATTDSLMLCFVYFLSCSGLPPQKGRVTEWVKSWFTVPQTASDSV